MLWIMQETIYFYFKVFIWKLYFNKTIIVAFLMLHNCSSMQNQDIGMMEMQVLH